MATLAMQVVRDNLRDVIDFVRFKNGKVTIMRRGRPVAEIVPIAREAAPTVATRIAQQRNIEP